MQVQLLVDKYSYWSTSILTEQVKKYNDEEPLGHWEAARSFEVSVRCLLTAGPGSLDRVR